MKKFISYLMICICCLGLCGCTAYPELSEEDMDLVAEYAAGLLLQHSAKAEKRLVDLEEAVLEEEVLSQDEELIEEPEEEVVEEPVEEEKPEADTSEMTEQEVIPSGPINQVLGLDNITVQSNGYEVKESYSDGENGFFALDASTGCKLVIMKYTLLNQSGNSVDIDMLDSSATYKVALDGSGYKYALSTMLLDDLSTYVGTISSNESVELVLISEWKEEEVNNITNLTLYIQNGDMTGKYPVE